MYKAICALAALCLVTTAFANPAFLTAQQGQVKPGSPSDTPGVAKRLSTGFEPPTHNNIGTEITSIPFRISEPGYYYITQDLVNTEENADGISIDVDSVTLNLNGHALIGTNGGGAATAAEIPDQWEPFILDTTVNSDDGIFILGDQDGIKILNGSVVGWGGSGINALNGDFSTFTDLYIAFNNEDGLVTDFSCIIENVTSAYNEEDGIETDDGSVIRDCTSAHNNNEGFQTSEGCTVVNCTAYGNKQDGFDISAGGLVKNSVAYDNGFYGFNMAQGTMIIDSVAHNNKDRTGSDNTQESTNEGGGFDMASACLVDRCIGSENEGHGIYVRTNGFVVNSKFYNNAKTGIYCQSIDSHIEGNLVVGNQWSGIYVNVSANYIVRNYAAENVIDSADEFAAEFGFVAPGNQIKIAAGNTHGPVITASESGDISGLSGADHPLANFEY